MIHRTRFSISLLASLSMGLLNAGFINTAIAAQENPHQAQQSESGKIQGKVTDVINVARYTYAEVDTGKEKVWVAGPPTPLKKGDKIAFTTQMPMQNFHSKSIDRDFPLIYFINQYITDPGNTKTTAVQEPLKQKSEIKPITGINKVAGGSTIADIYQDKSSLNGKTVRVRGQVTKFTANILGKNWLHIRDSSTLEDLTVTTKDSAAVGDTVIAEGKLELDKDYNYGYLYPVIMEQATVTKE